MILNFGKHYPAKTDAGIRTTVFPACKDLSVLQFLSLSCGSVFKTGEVYVRSVLQAYFPEACYVE